LKFGEKNNRPSIGFKKKGFSRGRRKKEKREQRSNKVRIPKEKGIREARPGVVAALSRRRVNAQGKSEIQRRVGGEKNHHRWPKRVRPGKLEEKKDARVSEKVNRRKAG